MQLGIFVCVKFSEIFSYWIQFVWCEILS